MRIEARGFKGWLGLKLARAGLRLIMGPNYANPNYGNLQSFELDDGPEPPPPAKPVALTEVSAQMLIEGTRPPKKREQEREPHAAGGFADRLAQARARREMGT